MSDRYSNPIFKRETFTLFGSSNTAFKIYTDAGPCEFTYKGRRRNLIVATKENAEKACAMIKAGQSFIDCHVEINSK
jgi:hypothetical protein